MYQKIIVGLALDHGVSDRTLNCAKSLLSEGGQIIAVHVSEPVNDVVQSLLSQSDLDRAQASINDLLAQRLSQEPNIQSEVLTGHSGQELIKYAGKVGADCIVVSSHKPGLEQLFLGSTASRVARHAKCSVHVAR